MPDTHLILHVKGTENETTTLPRQVVRSAISQGQITHSQLIWSPTENAWKQVRELPHLLPSQKLAPAPTPRVATGTMPKVVVVPRGQGGAVPRVAAKATVAASATPSATPRVHAAVRPQGAADRGASTGALKVKEEHGPNPLKWICIILGVVIVLMVVVNYFLVDQPLRSRLAQTAFSNVSVHAHLGAFAQPNVAVIHIPASTSLNESNLSSFLIALAKSTPNAPMGGGAFGRVALTPSWTGHYSFSGYAWKQLGDMAQDDEAQRREFILDQIGDAGGQPLISGTASMTDEALQARREKVWKAFAAEFIQR